MFGQFVVHLDYMLSAAGACQPVRPRRHVGYPFRGGRAGFPAFLLDRVSSSAADPRCTERQHPRVRNPGGVSGWTTRNSAPSRPNLPLRPPRDCRKVAVPAAPTAAPPRKHPAGRVDAPQSIVSLWSCWVLWAAWCGSPAGSVPRHRTPPADPGSGIVETSPTPLATPLRLPREGVDAAGLPAGRLLQGF